MYFDGGIFIGREPKYGLENKPEEILARLEARSVDRALAAHFEAVYYDMYTGNAKMLAIAKSSGGKLLPLAVVNPFHYDATGNYLSELKASGFAGIVLLSHYQYWKFDQYALRRLAKDLSKFGLPIQVGVANLSELASTVDLFKDSESPVLVRWLRGGGYNALADEIAIAKDYPQFYFDVANAVAVGDIAELAAKIGAERLYLSSNSPLVYEASPYFLLESADLSEADRVMIARGTLAKIFSIENKTVDAHSAFEIYDRDLTRRKIDIHWHTHGWDIIEPGKELPAMKKIFDLCNYQKVVCSSVMALNYDLAEGNRQTAEMIATDRRMYAYIVVDPIRPDASLAELAKYKSNPRFIGVKTIQDYYNIGVDDQRYEPMWRWAEANNYPVLCHRAGVATAAKKFPKLKFIAAHLSWERWGQLLELGSLPNVWLDVSGSYAHRGETDLAALVRAVGADKILFSADGPLISPYWALGKWVDVSLTEDELQKIYYDNALRIFPQLA